MHYTKAALLIFGLGLSIGFVVVVGEFPEWERTAAAIMALGLVMLPMALFADGRGMAALRWIAGRFSRSKGKQAPARRRPSAPRRKAPARAAARRRRG